MKVQITSDNRELILRIMQERIKQEARYRPLPAFSYAVGSYTLTRDGCIEVESDDCGLFAVLAMLGMCDYPFGDYPVGDYPFGEYPFEKYPFGEYPFEGHPFEEPAPAETPFTWSTKAHSVGTLMNLISIVSARQSLLNRALDNRNAFFVSRSLMGDLLAHPPATIPEFLQALYGRDEEYSGLVFTLSHFSMSGFYKCRPEEAEIHRQLAGLVIKAATNQQWSKAFTPRVRNQKYAFRTWLNSIGMIGPEYEAARLTLLSRLPGRADQRKIPSRKEA